MGFSAVRTLANNQISCRNLRGLSDVWHSATAQISGKDYRIRSAIHVAFDFNHCTAKDVPRIDEADLHIWVYGGGLVIANA